VRLPVFPRNRASLTNPNAHRPAARAWLVARHGLALLLSTPSSRGNPPSPSREASRPGFRPFGPAGNQIRRFPSLDQGSSTK